MKIVHVCHLYYPSKGGIQTYFKNVSERLVRDYGDEVTVVTTNSYFGPEKTYFKKIEPSEEIINGVTVKRFSYTRWHIKPLRFIIKLFRKFNITVPETLIMFLNGPYSPTMFRYLKHVNADAVFAASSNYYYMQLPLWRRCNFFYFASIHLDEDENKTHLLKKQMECMNASTLYIANTNFEAKRMVEAGLQPDKAYVLGCGVEMSDFVLNDNTQILTFKEKAGIPEKATVVGYVGRIEKTKNVQLAIDAFIKVSADFPDAYLLIAGTGQEYANELKTYVSQRYPKVAERIIFITEFETSQKAAIFHSLDILVLPSKNESFGLVFLEAWSCKKPVIGTSIGAVRDVITDGFDGLIAQPDNVDQLEEMIRKLLSDKDLRIAMGQNGYKKVQENFTWDIIVSRLRKCYIAATENKRN